MIPIDFLKIVDSDVDMDTNGSTLQKYYIFNRKILKLYLFFVLWYIFYFILVSRCIISKN